MCTAPSSTLSFTTNCGVGDAFDWSQKKGRDGHAKNVINKSYEPFCVSHKALLRLRKLGQELGSRGRRL